MQSHGVGRGQGGSEASETEQCVVLEEIDRWENHLESNKGARRVGSAAKGTCSSRRPELSSQHHVGRLTIACNSSSRDSCVLLVSMGTHMLVTFKAYLSLLSC